VTTYLTLASAAARFHYSVEFGDSLTNRMIRLRVGRLLVRIDARKRAYMRARTVAILALLGLVAGGGGAVAMAESHASGGSAAVAQYGCLDRPPDKCEDHRDLVHHCKNIHWRSENCKAERREIRRCEKKRSMKFCKMRAGPMRR
jgi:hypothetical protein